MSDTLITIIGVFLAAVLMFVFPLMTVSNTQDNIAQVSVQSLVAEFVNNVATKGKITQDDYNAFISKLYATGNTYDVQLEHKKMTTNPNKGADDQIGENLYYSVYNSVIVDSTETGVNYNKEYLMKKGDYIIVTVKNTNTTIGSQIKNFIYSIIEKDMYRIAANSSALVVNTGSPEVDSNVSDDVETNNPIEEFEYKIIYHRNYNASDTEIVEKQYRYNDEIDLSNQGFIKEVSELGVQDFYGWNTHLNGQGNRINTTSDIRNLVIEDNMEFHLYAIWRPYIDLKWIVDYQQFDPDGSQIYGEDVYVYLKVDNTTYGYVKNWRNFVALGATWEITKVKVGTLEYSLIEPAQGTAYGTTEINIGVNTYDEQITQIKINQQIVLSRLDINWELDGEKTSNRITVDGSYVYAVFEVNNNGRPTVYADYYELQAVGTPWKIHQIKHKDKIYYLDTPIEGNTKQMRRMYIKIKTKQDGTIEFLGIEDGTL